MKGVSISPEALRMFSFASLQLTGDSNMFRWILATHITPSFADDESAILPSKDDLEALGTIRVDVYRIICHDWADSDFRRAIPDQLDSEHALHERTKKAGSHRVKYASCICRLAVVSGCTQNGRSCAQTHKERQDRVD